MSYTYHLLCVDTLEVLDLGKLVCLDESGVRIPWRATGWRDQSDGHRIEGEELHKAVERFLTLCRGKELRLVPDVYLHEIDPSGEVLQRIDTFGEVMDREVNPPPDTNGDMQRIPTDLTDRLKRICATIIAKRNV